VYSGGFRIDSMIPFGNGALTAFYARQKPGGALGRQRHISLKSLNYSGSDTDWRKLGTGGILAIDPDVRAVLFPEREAPPATTAENAVNARLIDL
jgi:hypothetical protein